MKKLPRVQPRGLKPRRTRHQAGSNGTAPAGELPAGIQAIAMQHRGNETDAPLGQLSDRELEIFELIGRGGDSRKISAQLHISPRTVDVHRANIKRKLRLKSSTELVQRAVHWLQMNHRGL